VIGAFTLQKETRQLSISRRERKKSDVLVIGLNSFITSRWEARTKTSCQTSVLQSYVTLPDGPGTRSAAAWRPAGEGVAWSTWTRRAGVATRCFHEVFSPRAEHLRVHAREKIISTPPRPLSETLRERLAEGVTERWETAAEMTKRQRLHASVWFWRMPTRRVSRRACSC